MTSETMKYTAAKVGSMHLKMPGQKKKARGLADHLGAMRKAGAFMKKGARG